MFSINANTAACLFIRSAMTRRWSSSEWRANSTRIGTSCVACATAGTPRRPSGWTAISTRSGNRRQSIWPRSFFRPYSELAMPNCAAMPGGEVVTLFETLRNVLPRSLFTHLGEPPRAIEVPHRVAELIRAREEDSERLIGWVQLVMAATFAALYVIAPRPLDAGMSMLAPVPLALSGYAAFTAARLWFAHRGFLPGWLLVLSMLVDTALLLGLIWAFHFQYEQPAAFSLKVPTFVYIFAFIALRALRFDHRYVLSAGLFAAAGWALLVILAIQLSDGPGITRNFVAYITSNSILIGAEFDKIFTILMVTALLAIAVQRARSMLVTAMREEAAGREVPVSVRGRCRGHRRLRDADRGRSRRRARRRDSNARYPRLHALLDDGPAEGRGAAANQPPHADHPHRACPRRRGGQVSWRCCDGNVRRRHAIEDRRRGRPTGSRRDHGRGRELAASTAGCRCRRAAR